MLMLGESVLSLLIVDVTESSVYYKTFFSGIISITLLEYLHFRSQPHNPDDHALRRSKEAGGFFSILMQVYSAALISLGASYKMLLYEYLYEAKSSTRALFPLFARFLTSSTDAASRFSTADRRQRVADFFCASMAIVWFCSDVMTITHRGLKDNLGRCRCSRTKVLRKASLAFFFARVGLVVFIATLSRYVTTPDQLAFIGLIGILTQVLLRFLGSSIFGEKYDSAPGGAVSVDENIWPNVTQPQSVEVDDENTKPLKGSVDVPKQLLQATISEPGEVNGAG